MHVELHEHYCFTDQWPYNISSNDQNILTAPFSTENNFFDFVFVFCICLPLPMKEKTPSRVIFFLIQAHSLSIGLILPKPLFSLQWKIFHWNLVYNFWLIWMVSCSSVSFLYNASVMTSALSVTFKILKLSFPATCTFQFKNTSMFHFHDFQPVFRLLCCHV